MNNLSQNCEDTIKANDFTFLCRAENQASENRGSYLNHVIILDLPDGDVIILNVEIFQIFILFCSV